MIMVNCTLEKKDACSIKLNSHPYKCPCWDNSKRKADGYCPTSPPDAVGKFYF